MRSIRWREDMTSWKFMSKMGAVETAEAGVAIEAAEAEVEEADAIASERARRN